MVTMRVNPITVLVLAAAAVLVWYIWCHRHAVSDSLPHTDWHARTISLQQDSLRSHAIIDSLDAAIRNEHEQQRLADSMAATINANPKYRAHAYRDSTTAAKLQFIIGADRR